jgi:hypothetical protein
MTSLLYTAELDLAEGDIKPFLDWYAYRHAPDLVPLGFESSACYGTTGGDMNLFDIYEIPNRDLFYGAGYRRMNERDTYAAPILASRRNKAHTIYAQHRLDIGGLSAGGRLDADWITVSRFDSAADTDALAAVLSGHAGAWSDAGNQDDTFWQPHHRPSGLHHEPAALHAAVRVATPARRRRRTDRPCHAGDRPQGRRLTPDHVRGHRIYPWPDDEDAKSLR